MLMADDRSNMWSSEEGFLYDEENDFGDGLSIDMEELLDMLGQNSDSSEVISDEFFILYASIFDFFFGNCL